MSREIFEFSLLIDQEFEPAERPLTGFISFLLRLFKLS